MIEVSWTDTPPAVWDELAVRDPRATLFHRPQWQNAVGRVYPDARPLVGVATRNGNVVGILPALERRHLGLRQLLSMPMGTFGGPVLTPEGGTDAARALLHAFQNRVQGARTIRYELSLFDPPSVWRGFVGESSELQTHVIDLSAGVGELWNRRYDRNTRNCVRMAERAGVVVSEERGEEWLDVLHRLYVEQAKRWSGSAFVERRALTAIMDAMGDAARLYIARHEGVPLVACLCLEWPGREIHPWVSGGSEEARRTRASHLLYHRAIGDAANRGIPLWHFGGSMGNEKIEFFKESLGAVPRPVIRTRHVARWWLRVKPGAS